MNDRLPPPETGLALSRAFYREAVRPLLERRCPGLPHAAALIGPGSEVLGFDDSMSRDHDWGPRVLLFLSETDHRWAAAPLHDFLAHHLPTRFHGYPTSFSPPDPNDNGTRLLEPLDSGPVNHRVALQTLPDFTGRYLNVDLDTELRPADWLSRPEHKLRTLTAGEVFHDDDRVGLNALRARFAYYPHDVWLYLLAAGWARIGQEEHLMGRAGLAGDEIGSALIAARLVRDIMRLVFMMAKVYAPYAKWFGAAFRLLPAAPHLAPHLERVLAGGSWETRQQALLPVYEQLAALHNNLALTRPLPEKPAPFFNRPFQVIAIHGFAEALTGEIQDPAVREIAHRPLIGGVDQFSDSTDLLSNARWRPVLRRLYEPGGDPGRESS